jgi:hypothetical protein
MLIRRVRTDDTAPQKSCVEYWAGPFLKRCSRGRCTPHNLLARSITVGTSGSSTGVCMESGVWQGKMFPCGSMRGNLKVEYQATALSLYELSIEKKTGEITEVKNPRRIETHFRSPQLDLWRLSDTEWLLALRRPDPVARKKPGKIVPLAEQLVLPEFSATGS